MPPGTWERVNREPVNWARGRWAAGEPDPGELARRVMNLGHEMAQDSATETDT